MLHVCWDTATPPAHHWPSIGSMSRVCCEQKLYSDSVVRTMIRKNNVSLKNISLHDTITLTIENRSSNRRTVLKRCVWEQWISRKCAIKKVPCIYFFNSTLFRFSSLSNTSKRKNLTDTFISVYEDFKLKTPFGLHGLYGNISALSELKKEKEEVTVLPEEEHLKRRV